MAAIPRDALTILIIEDEALVRACVVEFFQDEGYCVLEADSGEAAIRWLDESVNVDIVFTDIRLGGRYTGWDVAEAFRTKHPKIPIIYTSGYMTTPPRIVDRGLFFTKPYQHEDILVACKKLIAA